MKPIIDEQFRILVSLLLVPYFGTLPHSSPFLVRLGSSSRMQSRITRALDLPARSRFICAAVMAEILRSICALRRRGPRGEDARHHATAPRPFFATSVSSFSDAPRGRFSPRSHWLTSPVVTLR